MRNTCTTQVIVLVLNHSGVKAAARVDRCPSASGLEPELTVSWYLAA
jgi:hypothetical protein